MTRFGRFVLSLVAVGFLINICICRAQQTKPAPQSRLNVYSDNIHGLQMLLDDLMKAADTGDGPKELSLVNSLIFSPESTWFTDTFGPAFGPRLSAAYEGVKPHLTDQMKAIFEGNVQHGVRVPEILRYDDPARVNSPIDTYLNCMNHITPLYQTALNGGQPSIHFRLDSTTPGRMRPMAGDLPGYYVYAEGGFRFIPSNVLSLLPEQRPVRVQLDMSVMKSKVTHRVAWVYPTEALKQHVKGKVVIHLTLDTTGKVKEVRSIEGPQIFSDTIVPALKQWIFEPTTLDGDLVEVDLAFEANFQ